jgi:hypothetical protein
MKRMEHHYHKKKLMQQKRNLDYLLIHFICQMKLLIIFDQDFLLYQAMLVLGMKK